jgi:hypothetical protein
MEFPSDAHRQALLQSCHRDLKKETLSLAPLTDEQRWFWHSYDYGWRRVIMEDFSKQSPIDRSGEWYDASLARAAEDFYRRKFNKPRQQPRPDPTPEDIAEVEVICNKIRANIARFVERSQQAFRPRRP